MTPFVSLLAEIVVALMLVVAGIFGLVGSLGLVKLDDTMRRLHAPTKATTLGIGGVLIASMVYSAAFLGRVSMHELMITIFLFLTAPITAHFVAKAYMHRHLRPEDLPPTEGTYGWAVYDAVPEEERPIDTK
ncbi:MAG: Na+/H+ antiporter subunit G [Deinococcus-Thermus bacterium]|jgi:multicomponent K+:H+ antiporter subunit G|nr:Na+/H+ antiporter subunit G [Deinococcota bacterium]